MVTKPHALTGVRPSLDHRAKIAASKIVSREEFPERWELEYEIALEALKKRANWVEEHPDLASRVPERYRE